MDVQRRRLPTRSVTEMIAERAPAIEGTTYRIAPGVTPAFDGVLPEAFVTAIQGSDTGAVLYRSRGWWHLVVPPFPIQGEGRDDGWRTDALEEVLERPRRTGVLLLRLGGFAVGVYERDALVASKVGGRFVKARHSKGGSSQARFARRRQEQARALFRKACEVLRERLEADLPSLDHFLYGGDRRTVAAFEKECAFAQRLEPICLRRVLDVGDPRQATLERLPRLLYESVVLSMEPDGMEEA